MYRMPIRRGTHPRVTSLRPTLEYALASHGTTCAQLRADGRLLGSYPERAYGKRTARGSWRIVGNMKAIAPVLGFVQAAALELKDWHQGCFSQCSSDGDNLSDDLRVVVVS